ncbi:MAG: pgl [Segetibacter sp.]|jgi:6-phosphogluconolactonase|nr:pgl [Segetibacter sp.]
MPKLHIYKNEKETCNAFAEWFVQLVNDTLKTADLFTIVLSAGEIPKPFYKLISADFIDKIDWTKIHIFSGDESLVTFSDAKGSSNNSEGVFFETFPLSPAHIHTINKNMPPEEAARNYEELLRTFFNHSSSTFNLAILGLGEDGNTLSLFPGNDENNDSSNWVIPIYNTKEDLYKISLTAPVINASAVKAFLITGKRKQEAVENVLKGKYQPEKYTAQLIQTVNKTVHWFLDEAAAGKLIKPTL